MKMNQIRFLILAGVSLGLTVYYFVVYMDQESSSPKRRTRSHQPVTQGMETIERRSLKEKPDALESSESVEYGKDVSTTGTRRVDDLPGPDESQRPVTKTLNESDKDSGTTHVEGSQGDQAIDSEEVDERVEEPTPIEPKDHIKPPTDPKSAEESTDAQRGGIEARPKDPKVEDAALAEVENPDDKEQTKLELTDIEQIEDQDTKEEMLGKYYQQVIDHEPDKLNKELGYSMLDKYIKNKEFDNASKAYKLLIEKGHIKDNEEGGCLKAKVELLNPDVKHGGVYSLFCNKGIGRDSK